MVKSGGALQEVLVRLKVKAQSKPELKPVYEEGFGVHVQLFAGTPDKFSEVEKVQEFIMLLDEFLDSIDKKPEQVYAQKFAAPCLPRREPSTLLRGFSPRTS